MKSKFVLAAILGVLVSANSHAILLTEVSDNAYITVSGYDVAWIGPCALVSPSCGPADFSHQSQFGWEAMNSTLFASLGITAYDFVFEGANVDYATGNNLDEDSGASVDFINDPLNGDIAVATPWFSNAHTHIDWSNGVDGMWSFSDINGASHFDSLAFRVSASQPPSDIPEPASIAILGLGLVGLGLAKKRAR